MANSTGAGMVEELCSLPKFFGLFYSDISSKLALHSIELKCCLLTIISSLLKKGRTKRNCLH